MKIIERPESTTYVDEIPYHYIKNIEEMNNVMKGVSKKDVIIIRKVVHPDTFQPLIFAAVPHYNKIPTGVDHQSDTMMSKYHFYVWNIELFYNGEKDEI